MEKLRKLTIGAKAIFNTTQSDLLHLNGQEITVLRELDSTECDIEEVGYMYEIRFYNDETVQAFVDELL